MISGSERSTPRAILGAKINFLACFFYKHKLHLIQPMIIQKKVREMFLRGQNWLRET